MSEKQPRSLYLHVPFCRHRCGYCNFTLVAGRDDLIDRFLAAVEKELETVEPCEVETVFIGGGTPTHLSEPQLERLIQSMQKRFSFVASCEFSIEGNPLDLVDERKVGLLKSLGVSRVSLGVQSFQTPKLKVLERDHDRETVLTAFEIVKQQIPNVSLDLIIGAPGETLPDWEGDLDSALQLNAPHISTYSLTIEKGTQFWNRFQRDQLPVISDTAAVEFYEASIDTLTAAGYEHYEVSNFAIPGFRCRHNENYWLGGQYFGFGPGAARYVKGIRETNHRSTTQYIKLMEQGVSPVQERDVVDDEAAAREKLIFGLRRREGIRVSQFAAETGFEIASLAGSVIEQLVHAKLMTLSDDRLALTRSGLLVSDSLWPEFL